MFPELQFCILRRIFKPTYVQVRGEWLVQGHTGADPGCEENSELKGGDETQEVRPRNIRQGNQDD